jgi:hypothetical protein
MMKRTRTMTVVLAASLLPVLVFGAGCNSCGKKDDDDKPATSASAPPAPTPTPTAPATVVPEEPDAGVDAGIDAGKPVVPGGGGGSGSLAKCCAALAQNANSAPLEQKVYYMQAAAACNGMRNTPAGQQAFSNLRAYLQGAKMPGACK